MSSSQSAIPVLPRRDGIHRLPLSSTLVRRKSPGEPPPDVDLDLDDLEVDEETLVPQSNLSRDSAAMRIVEVLVARGVNKFFGIPGGPISPLFEALRLHPEVELVESRHESHAAFSAASYFRATGETAAVVVTAGPGVTNVVTGVASAYMEAVPMIIIAGDVAWASHGGRLAQNSGPEGLNIDNMLAPITNAQIRVTNGRSALGQAVAVIEAANNPLRPGPALLVLPIDRATEYCPNVAIPAPTTKSTVVASREAVRTAARWLAGAERPLIVLGGGCVRHAAWVRQLVDVLDVPFVTTPRAKGVVSEEHPRSLRNGGMAASLWARKYTASAIDVALVLGSDLDDTSVGPTPYIGQDGRLIHVDLDPRVFNRNLPTQLAITADLQHFCRDLYQVVTEEGYINSRGRSLAQEVRRSSPFDVPHFQTDRSACIAPHRAVADLQAALPQARFTTDIGEHMLFALHYLVARGPQDFHIQLNLGSMGSGIAGATGLALADETRPVVCICGDGGMQMSGMEILTSQRRNLPVLYAVFNDSRYNMVHHGMKQIFGDSSDYDSPKVDFAAWAGAMGIPARIIRRPGQISSLMIDDLMGDGGPALLDIRIDRDVRLRGGGRVEALQHMSMVTTTSKGGDA